LKGNVELVRTLIAHGVDLYHQSHVAKRQHTTAPLASACKYGHLEIVEMLLEEAKQKLNPIERLRMVNMNIGEREAINAVKECNRPNSIVFGM
jgi:hypothetical protein